jgi:dihydroorotase-like cyclic amidohydrolase
MSSHDLVLRGGRVIDPETGLDGVRDIGIDGQSISAMSAAPLTGASVLDVSGLLVAPGFIDLHSHAQSLAGRRLQACDGVTAAFDLEAGRTPVSQAYALEAADGSPIHYGFSSSWAAVRMAVLGDDAPAVGIDGMISTLGDPSWQGPANSDQESMLLDLLSADLADGAIGIGMLMGYAPEVDPAEYLAVARLAAQADVPTFTHCRDLIELNPETRIDGAEELVRAASETGAHMHHCHVNSTSGRHIDRVLALVERCRSEGGRVTVEAYPYGSGATAIGAAFLAPDRLRQRGLLPTSLIYLPTGERVASESRLSELRATDPGGLVIIDFFDESAPADRAVLRRSLEFADAIVASDAMPLVSALSRGGRPDDDDEQSASGSWLGRRSEEWPLPPGFITHPRTAGCFSRALRLWREDGSGTPLAEAVRRCTLLPAQVLESSTPAMRHKGRIQPGADADIVVFDPEAISDQATYDDSTRLSSGIRHVLVDGTFVLRDSGLLPESRPGRPLRGSPR